MRTTGTSSPGWRQRLVIWLLPLLIAACGGGGGDTASDPGAASGAATLGAAGGAVREASGVRVDVPANALATDTTIRIARDGTGAPALPEGLTAAGALVAITPHGTRFTQPVAVRLPLPATALGANQVWKIAKAEVGGTWELLDDTVVEGGMLKAEVSSFSYFVPVVVNYPLATVDLRPLSLDGVDLLDCGGQDCNDLVGPVTMHLRVRMSGSQLPSFCPEPAKGWTLRVDYETARSVQPDGSLLITVVNGADYGPWANPATVRAVLDCTVHWRETPRIGSRSVTVGRWRALSYPALAVLPQPATLDVVDGRAAMLDATLMGGAAATWVNGQRELTAGDSAVVDWQRSDDQGRSWRTIAQTYQFEADRRPFGGSFTNVDWEYWRVSHGFVPSVADAGAQLRVRACYTPRDVAPQPCVTSGTTTLNLLQASAFPSLTQWPRSVLVRSGQTASFNAAATGAPAPALQWQTREANSTGAWTDVPGATGTGYTTAVLGLADNGRQYRVVASNGAGSVESPVVTVSVSDLDVAPIITTQPANLAVAAGGDAVFAIAATGTEALSYQWRFNGSPIAGANGPMLRLAAVTGAQAGRYSVVVSNGAGSVTSDNATLDVTAGAPAAQAPTIVTQPVSVLTHVGNTATFGVGVAGSGPIAYQWLKAGQPIAGATAATYSVASATLADDGSYAVRVSNAAGSVTSWNVVLTVNEAAQPQALAITTQPSPQLQLPGGSATFAVAASGSGPISYQWLKNGAPIAGATASVLTLAGLTGSDAGSYAVTVSNSLGSVTSNAAALTVVGAPVIGTQPAAQSVTAGATASFSVSASGSGLRYQWTLNGVAIVGATGSSYTTPATTLADNGAVFGVVVYNGAGIAFGESAVLTVNAAPPPSPEGKIAAGLDHTCAVHGSNALYCWGNGGNGALGDGAGVYRDVPTRVSTIGTVKSVAAGGWSSCAIDSADALWCWGALNDALSPVRISAQGVSVIAVAVGSTHACYVDAAGDVYCWGGNDLGQAGGSGSSAVPRAVRRGDGSVLGGAVALAAGFDYSCAQRADGSVWCWGADIGSNARTTAQRVLRRLPDGSTMDFTITGRLAGGLHHVCGAESGSAQPMCWGHNEQGQLGDGTTVSRDQAMPAGLFGVMRLAAGATHTCAIRTSDMYCWGYGFMGNGAERETLLSPVVAGRVGAYFESAAPPQVAAAGERHTCALRSNGDVQCWGWNNAGQVGNGTFSDTVNVLVPTSTTLGAAFWGP